MVIHGRIPNLLNLIRTGEVLNTQTLIAMISKSLKKRSHQVAISNITEMFKFCIIINMASTQEPLLQITPNDEVVFEFVPNETITSILELVSLAGTNVAFKLKTTAPKVFLIRPNQGVLAPGETVNL